jgi:hypothetical protein
VVAPILVRHRAIVIAAGSLGILFRWKVSNLLLVAATAVIRLIAFPLLHPACDGSQASIKLP